MPGDRPRFEVLFVEDPSTNEVRETAAEMGDLRSHEDGMVYDVSVVSSFEEALEAVLDDPEIQCCVIPQQFPVLTAEPLSGVRSLIPDAQRAELQSRIGEDPATVLAEAIHEARPELGLFLTASSGIETAAARLNPAFRRVFHAEESMLELHLAILQAVQTRLDTPFFSALKRYSRQPHGVFHALPIARGNSIFKSQWIKDFGEFYGTNIFLAETSATTGGLDSLLQPTGTLKEAQALAARAFGSRRTFFVTNGTSTANKIVVLGIIQPGDIVLVDRNCHGSHHYGMVLSGAYPVYLDAYPLGDYCMYGAVPLVEIKRKLLALKRAGQLDRVKMLLLTNCTFDGLVYDAERVMEEALAIKPDLVFLWDEAWFGFARCDPSYRQRTAMHAAARLRARYDHPDYKKAYLEYREKLNTEDDEALVHQRLMPDPERVRVRVYSTQSTHKTLSCFRQGSMIHMHDEDFNRTSEGDFMEAYMAHTSTSPNYQILASLDVARRQIELEGYALVRESVRMARAVRQEVARHPLLRRYFKILEAEDLIPAEFRSPAPSGNDQVFASGEFVLDPTRLTLYIGKTGIDGGTFRGEYLMNQFGIQINKTSLNSVLFMTNIGTTWSAVGSLLDCLVDIATDLEQRLRDFSPEERAIHEAEVARLTQQLPPLPNFSSFHRAFRPHEESPAGDMRKAYFLAYDEDKYEYIKMDGSIERAVQSGRELVSCAFIAPYPPGFPVLVPGQVVSQEIITFLKKLDIKEIHGYRPELGFRVFTQEILDRVCAEK